MLQSIYYLPEESLPPEKIGIKKRVEVEDLQEDIFHF